MTLLLDVRPSSFARDPATGGRPRSALRCQPRRRSDLAIKSHGRFQRHQGNTVANVTCESLIQSASFRLQSSNFHVNAGHAQLLKTLPTHLGIRIGHGSHYATNSGSDQGVGARWRPALVRVWFEIDVERAAAGFAAGLFESAHFSMLDAIVGVNTRTYDDALWVDDHSAYIRIG